MEEHDQLNFRGSTVPLNRAIISLINLIPTGFKLLNLNVMQVDMMISTLEQKPEKSEEVAPSIIPPTKTPVVIIPARGDEIVALVDELKVDDAGMKVDETEPVEPDSNEGTEGEYIILLSQA